MATHPVVQQITHAFLDETDRHAAGLVEGLYLIGSVALDDFRPGLSDVDFLAVTAAPVTGADLRGLRRAHARLVQRHRRPSFEGAYVTWDDLTRDPALAGPRVDVRGGQVIGPVADRCDPVSWQTLVQSGIAERGPAPAELGVWTDGKALADWTRANADGYWAGWHRRASLLPSRLGLAALTGWGPAWGVLGVSRLHYTLASGAITSKYGAGEYARDTFGERWHSIVDECLRLRRGGAEESRYRTRFGRRRDALRFMAMVLAEMGAKG